MNEGKDWKRRKKNLLTAARFLRKQRMHNAHASRVSLLTHKKTTATRGLRATVGEGLDFRE